MTTPNSHIQLYKNDFASAKQNEALPITLANGLTYNAFIMQKPNETFLQISSADSDIAFVGGIRVDLVDCLDTIVKNIDDNFAYETAQNTKGVWQIAFEFGYIGVDYWTKPLYLRITDLVNDNVWYSNGFLVTYYQNIISGKIGYTSRLDHNGTPYSLLPFIQTVRFACLFETPEPQNKVNQGSYTTTTGGQVFFNKVTTFLNRWIFDVINKKDYNILENVFSHPTVYLNGNGIRPSELKADLIDTSTNIIKAEFLVNPTGETFNDVPQLLEPLQLITRYPLHNGVYNLGVVNEISGDFNKSITLGVGLIRLYKNDVLINTFDQTDITVTVNSFSLSIPTINDTGNYSIQVDSGLFNSGMFVFTGVPATDWKFTVREGDYDINDYDNIDYFTN